MTEMMLKFLPGCLEHLSGSIEAERSRAMGLHVAAMMSFVSSWVPS